jgi:hypothetical protein
MDAQAITFALDHHGPGSTAHGAVLDEHAARIGIDVQVDPFAAIRTTNTNRVFHDRTRFV